MPVRPNPALVRQAKRWKAQADTIGLPDELYEALASGHAKAYERRVIRNLAKKSNIISEMGTIRPYAEFSKDWVYDRSVFGHTDKCELCGHAPIKENCVLKDENGQEILIGNTCVHRYIEIRDPKTGQVLDDEAKAEFLKENMTEAKAEYSRQEFAQSYPTALQDLKRFERMMHSRKPLKRLHKTVMGRLVKYGYLGPKTRRQWDEFMADAEKELKAYNAYKEQQAIEARARAERNHERAANFAQQIAKNRNQWADEADEFINLGNDLEDELNSWEKEMVGRVQAKIRSNGVASLRGGFLRFREELVARHLIANGLDIPLPPIASKLRDANKSGLLNEWESEFVKSIMGRLANGRSLSTGQQAVVDKIMKKVNT